MREKQKEHKTNECEQSVNQHYTESNLLFLVSVSIRTQIFLVSSKMRGNSTSDAEYTWVKGFFFKIINFETHLELVLMPKTGKKL